MIRSLSCKTFLQPYHAYAGDSPTIQAPAVHCHKKKAAEGHGSVQVVEILSVYEITEAPANRNHAHGHGPGAMKMNRPLSARHSMELTFQSGLADIYDYQNDYLNSTGGGSPTFDPNLSLERRCCTRTKDESEKLDATAGAEIGRVREEANEATRSAERPASEEEGEGARRPSTAAITV
jgi:hypothetical protein